MGKMKHKLLSCLMVATLFLSMIPMTAIGATVSSSVQTEEELIAAIQSIPSGGSGEITIENVYIVLSEGLFIEDKDIVFNLKNAQLSVELEWNSVLFVVNSNVTINADSNSFLKTDASVEEWGAIRTENWTWDSETEQFTETFELVVNGGKYSCLEGDTAFCVNAGYTATLTDVVCEGDVCGESGLAGVEEKGIVKINSGCFVSDVKNYVAEGKYFCDFGQKYYVRDKEMSDEFGKLLTDDKLVFDYVKPSSEEDAILWLAVEGLCVENSNVIIGVDSFNSDFSQCELGLYENTSKEEFHLVDVVWNSDSSVLETAYDVIDKFPEDREWFSVSDLELVNYWVYHNQESELDTLANYSGELKEYLNNSNFVFTVESRAGADDVFYTERIGSAKIMHDGIVYYAFDALGARAEHAIYIPESTANTKEALMEAAQKRIDEYIGENIVKITADDETVTDYYNGEIARYDAELATAKSELATAKATLDAEMAKDPSLWNQELITECQFKIMDCESEIQYIPGYKQYFIDSFAENGELNFLKKATGDFFFNVEVNDQNYKFIIIKDDTKTVIPSCSTVDLNTQIEIKTDSSSVPLDTVVEVDKLTEGTEYDRLMNILDVEENETFDIKLHSGSLNKYITKLEDGKFEVKIPLLDKWEEKDLVAYYVDENNEVTEYEVTVDEGEEYAVFATDHFSIYTLAEAVNTHEQHSGGTATCNSQAICSECGQAYGEKNASNHAGGTEIRDAKEATATENGYTGDTYCKGCGVKISSGEIIPATGTGEKTDSPKTGDISNMNLWLAIMFISGVIVIGSGVYGKREKNYNKK